MGVLHLGQAGRPAARDGRSARVGEACCDASGSPRRGIGLGHAQPGDRSAPRRYGTRRTASRALQVGDGAGQPQGAGPAAGRQAALPRRRWVSRARAGGVEVGDRLQDLALGRAFSAAPWPPARALGLERRARRRRARRASRRALGRRRQGQVGGGDRRRPPPAGRCGPSTGRRCGPGSRVWQRGALPQAPRPAPPRPQRQGFMAADQLHPGRIAHVGVGAGHHDLAGLQRLAQAVQRLGRELRQLVQEQHAVVGQGDLAGLGLAGRRRSGPPCWPSGAGCGTGRARVRAPLAIRPGHRVHHRGLEQLARRQRRQQAGQALRQHRLARARRADEQQVVAAGRGDLQRALGVLLALDVAQVGRPRSPSSTGPGSGGDSTWVPRKWLTRAISERGARIARRRRPRRPRARRPRGRSGPGPWPPAATAAGRAPATGRDPAVQRQFAHRPPSRPARPAG